MRRFKVRFFTILLFQIISSTLFAQIYCTPLNSICSDFQNFRIETVVIGSINNNSLCGVNGYNDYTNSITPATISAGTYIPLTVKVGAYGVNKIVTIGIDFNQNGVFNPNEISIIGTNATSNPLSPYNPIISNIVRIPFTALPGSTRLRVMVSNSAGISPLCSAGTFGEIEDYTINIIQATSAGANFNFYVNKLASGLNNGLSWANAFTELKTALNYAQGQDTIRVAAGMYKPVGAVQANLTSSTFSIRDSLIILGGYSNSGTPTDANRNYGINQTILDGQLFSNGVYVDNIISANLFPGVNSKSFKLDGFIIQKSGKEAIKLNGVIGAQIKNCVFRDNNGNIDGSIISCVNSNPVVSNCYFHKNFSGVVAGDGILISQNSNSKFLNCVFANNYSGKGLVSLNQSTGNFTNCNFVNDTISGNYNTVAYNKLIRAENNSVLNINNSIFSNNIFDDFQSKNNSDSSEIGISNSVININNTITQIYNYGNNSLLAKNPKFRDTANVTGIDNLYYTADDGLQLINPCSPAINAGLNNYALNIGNDILNNPRIFETVVDLGAYETQLNLLAVPATLYVNKLATGLNNGTSWANAFTDLQNAFRYCSDTIRVAAGSYYPSNTNTKVSFWLENGRVILGGYPNTGNPSDAQRNPALHQSILSGSIPLSANNLKSKVILRGRSVDITSVIDGFIIKDASGSSQVLWEHPSAIVLNLGATPRIKNCIFLNNSNASLNFSSSSPQLFNCTFENNSYGQILNNSIPKFTNCIFKNNFNNIGNVSPYYGGALLIKNSNPIFDSCIFLKNKANDFGGAIANFNSNPIISNCKFLGNDVPHNYSTSEDGRASDIYNNNSSPIVTNTLFSDSIVRSSAGSIENVNNSNGSFTNCIFRNCRAFYYGGVCLNDSSSPLFKNCAFLDSKALGGAIIYNKNHSNSILINCIANVGSFYNDNSNPIFLNSTFANTTFNSYNNSIVTITNCINWSTISALASSGDIGQTSGSQTIVKNSLTPFFGTNGVNGNIVGINPRLIDITNPAGPDSIYFTADDGLRLCSCSPAINTGSNFAVSGIVEDISNSPRIFNGIVDMGAYEYQSTNLTNAKTFFVNASVTGLNNGSTWSNAYKELKSAIQNTCADTIKVAQGIYNPAINSKDSSFYINRFLNIYGGYPNFGNPTDAQRNADRYPTILSGNIGVQSDSTDNARVVMHIRCADTTVSLQGLTFKNGNGGFSGNPGVPISYGGAGAGLLVSASKNISIKNCRFYNNTCSRGGGLYTEGAKNFVENCIFSNNKATIYGGGICINGNNNTVKNCVFDYNIGLTGGGAYCYGGSTLDTKFYNVIFYNNTSNFRGPGVYITGGNLSTSQPAFIFTNCNFIKNNHIGTLGSTNGLGLYYDNVQIQNYNWNVRNCIFKGNSNNGIVATTQYSDILGLNPQTYQSYNFNHCSTYSTSIYDTTNISPNSVTLRNINNAIGPDSLWFTADDGLQSDMCSLTTDRGEIAAVTEITTDIVENTRTYNNIPDIGAYENITIFTPQVHITASDSIICSGASVTFTAMPTSGGNSPSYQWQINGVNVGTNSNSFTSSILNNNDLVKVILTGNPTCATSTTGISNTIRISVNGNITPTVTIATNNNTICSGTVTLFTATLSSSASNFLYQWQINGVNVGTNSTTFTIATLNNNDLVKVILTNPSACTSSNTVTSNIITMTVTPAPSANAGNDVSICSGSSTQLVGSGGTTYLWSPSTGLSNATIVNPIASPTSTTAYILTANNGSCTSRDTVLVTVNTTAVPSVSISSSSSNICAGTSVTFTAIPINGGSSPTYQWQVNNVNAGTNSPTFTTSSLQNNDQVKVLMTSSLACSAPTSATSNAIIMSVTPAPIATAGTDVNICAGSSTQLVGSGGTTYLWSPSTGLNNPNIANPIATPTLTTSYILNAINGTCTSRDTVLVTVNASSVSSVNISSTNSNICSGTSVTFAASPTNGGTTPTYQWKVNGINAGTNSPTFTTSSLLNNDLVTVVMTSSLACAAPASVTSNAIIMAVTTAPIANAGNDVNICTGSSTQLNGSGGSTFSWSPTTGLSNANIANPVATPSTSTLYVLTVSNGSCTSKDSVRVIAEQPSTPTVSINTTSNNICGGSNATFTALALNAGANPSYQWQVNGINAGTNSATFSSNSLQNNAQVKVMVTTSGCTTMPVVTSNIITMNVTTLAQPLVSLNTNILTVTNADAAAVYTWQVVVNTVWSNVTPTATGITYTATQPGEYRVKAEKGVCTLYSASQVSARTNTLDSTLIYIYLNPNPTKGLITVNRIEPSQKWQWLEVINLQGMVVLPSINIRGLSSVPINAGSLAPGLYFVRLTKDDGRILSYKFIKE